MTQNQFAAVVHITVSSSRRVHAAHEDGKTTECGLVIGEQWLEKPICLAPLTCALCIAWARRVYTRMQDDYFNEMDRELRPEIY